jgi:hypothetical protein
MPTVNFLTNEPRQSQARGACEMGNAAAVFALSHAMTACGAATATVTSQAKIVSTLTYTIGGKFFSKGATDNFWTLTGAVVPAGSFQKYALLIDTAGAASVQEATPSTANAASVVWTNVSGLSGWPLLAVLSSQAGVISKAVAATLTVATDATHTFTPGTTLLGATGITATFQDGIDAALLPLLAGAGALVVGNGG